MMKNLTLLLFLLVLTPRGFSQCTPDPSCTDIGEPGQICPDSLPPAQLGITYNETITIIAPDSADIGSSVIALYKIALDTVTNLPEGLTYALNDTIMYPDSVYCVEITGTPQATGTFYLRISVTPYVFSDILGVVAFPAQVDSTSVFITVEEASGLNTACDDRMGKVSIQPNPFSREARVGMFIPEAGRMTLKVYSLTGALVLTQTMDGNPGENFFIVPGDVLPEGIYLFRIMYRDQVYTGKMVKKIL